MPEFMYDPDGLYANPILPNMSVGYGKPKREKKEMALKKLKPGMGIYQVMNMSSKAPDKSKPWAVVNLQTGAINGRWHASREEALAQARALYAKLGAKAKVHTEEAVHNAYFLFADAATLVAEDGAKWVEAIEPKTYITPAYGEVVITPEKIDAYVRNINTNTRGQEIAINFEHGIDPAKGLKAAGWIKQARKNDRGKLELAVDFTDTAKQEIKNGEWKYFSLEWEDEWLHPDGLFFQDVVVGGALTNRPVAKNLMPINFSEIFTEIDGELVRKPETNDDSELMMGEHLFATWDTKYVNGLPDSSFAWIEPGGTKTDGKTDSAHRHLPYKDASGKVDLAHVRNMLARVSQVNGIPSSVVSKVKALGSRLLGTKSQSELEMVLRRDYTELKQFAESSADCQSLSDAINALNSFIAVEKTEDDDDTGDIPTAEAIIKRLQALLDQERQEEAEEVAESPAEENMEDAYKAMSEAHEFASMVYQREFGEEKELEHSQPGTGAPRLIDAEFVDDIAITSGSRRNTPPFDEPPQVGPLYDSVENGEIMIRYSEAEAVGYCSAAVPGLRKIHTNIGDDFVERIERILATPSASRSLSELTNLANEVRLYLRANKNEIGEIAEHVDDSEPVTEFSEEDTTNSTGGYTVGDLTDRDLRELRAVLDVDDDAKIVEGVKLKFGELAALRDSVSASEQERIFAEQYPQFYEQHQKLVEEQRVGRAKAFSESVEKIRKAEGFGLKTTTQGLSTTAKEKIEEVHVKFSEGRATVDDFEETIKTIVHGGIVQFGELGSSQEEEVPEIDTSGPVGVANARKVFGELVAKEQRDNPEFTYAEAIASASRKNPDLAEAYKIALPA